MGENALFKALEDTVVEDIGTLSRPQELTFVLVEELESLLEVSEEFDQQETNLGFFVRQKPQRELLVVLIQWLNRILSLFNRVVGAFSRLELEVSGVQSRYLLDTVGQHLFLDVQRLSQRLLMFEALADGDVLA